jgi:hypothetical protein
MNCELVRNGKEMTVTLIEVSSNYHEGRGNNAKNIGKAIMPAGIRIQHLQNMSFERH